MRELLMHITAPSPFNFVRNLARINPLIINYHVVTNKKLPHITNLYNYRSVSRFIDDLDFLVRNFHPIGLSEFLAHIHEKTILPENSFLLTFDDGFREIYDIVAPILMSKKMTATFFLTTNYIDNKTLGYDQKISVLIEYLIQPENSRALEHINSIPGLQFNDKSDLKNFLLKIPYHNRALVDKIAEELKYDFDEYLLQNKPYITSGQVHELLKQGFTFGAHSIDHPWFSELNLDDQINQAITSIKIVTDKFSLPYKVFAFPYSDNNISYDFFKGISSYVDATFGTNGLLQDQIKNNFQRIGVETYKYEASKVLKFHFIRKLIYRKLDKDTIIRTNYVKA
jgi:peptidoglycan/xylan/chitin deacetylase (PgdA/CDA1 family)